jgi:hypothetical protein
MLITLFKTKPKFTIASPLLITKLSSLCQERRIHQEDLPPSRSGTELLSACIFHQAGESFPSPQVPATNWTVENIGLLFRRAGHFCNLPLPLWYFYFCISQDSKASEVKEANNQEKKNHPL